MTLTRVGDLIGKCIALSALLWVLLPFGSRHFGAPAGVAHAQYSGDLEQKPYDYDDVFPFYGKRMAARGVNFPLPWGVGLNYLFMQQPVA